MMHIKNTCKYSQIVSEISAIAEAQGVFLESGTDFWHFKEIIHSVQKSTQLGPKFDPATTEVNGDRAFWIVGRDVEGAVVHTQAICMVDLESLSLGAYLSNRYTDFIPFKLDANRSRIQPGPGLTAVQGTACYHGEFMLKRRFHGLENNSLSTTLFRLAVASSILSWSPDIIFAFMQNGLMCRGLAAKAGFMHTEPDSVIWARPGEDSTHKAWTVWLDNRDIQHLMKLTAIDLNVSWDEGLTDVSERKVA